MGSTLKSGNDGVNDPGPPPSTSCSALCKGGLNIPFDGPLRDMLQERAACDAMRSLHLRGENRSLLTSILSTLTPDNEDVRRSSIESIALRCVDASKFFACHRFPKLWYLDLSTGVTVSSWEGLGLHITALTTLSLTVKDMIRIPTTHRLLSILASNPRLQSLSLQTHDSSR